MVQKSNSLEIKRDDKLLKIGSLIENNGGKYKEKKMEILPDELQGELCELMKFEQEIDAHVSYSASKEDVIKQWLNKAREIARKYNPDSFSISAGIPFGAQLSFTWNKKEVGEKGMWG